MGEQGKILDCGRALVDAGQDPHDADRAPSPINAANLKQAHALLESGTARARLSSKASDSRPFDPPTCITPQADITG